MRRTAELGAAAGDGRPAEMRVDRTAGPLQRHGLNFVLVATMVLGPIPMMLPAVLAVELIAELGITTGAFSVALTANTIVAALFAPLSGRLTDRIGPKLSTVATVGTAGVGMLGMAFATNLWVLMASAAFAGLGQGWCNPATNKLIAVRVPAGRRGTITGLKQSGVMLGIFLSGATLPTLAVWFGWRTAIGIYGAAALAFALGTSWLMRPDHPAPADGKADDSEAGYEAPAGAVFAVSPKRVHPEPVQMSNAERLFIIKIAWFSLLMGSVVGGVGRFQVLFTEEVLGWTNFWAGMASALAGITAAVSRVWWARLTEARVPPASALVVQSAFTVVAMALLLAAAPIHSGLIWAMSLLAGFTMMSWNAVVMLAVITGVPVAVAGRASGIVMLGFMSGLSIGGLAAGYVIEWTGSYDAVWMAFVVCAAGACALATTMRRQR
ncbi:MFS transporter [Candidatus Poriferisodalis sp.]|uniref:MFS transporter n=1 Tax=Candidatus Poriferisodalis sp. TaxID=3101277 RepID=UPI003B028E83